MPRRISPCAVLAAISALLLAAAPDAHAAGAADCRSLASLRLPQTTLSTTFQTATATLPEHCHVDGVIGPGAIGFTALLPTAWNNRLYHGGGGGYVGSIPDTTGRLAQGYATTSTDTGHKGTGPLGGALDATWALNNPQAVIDFGYRAVHLTTTMTKALVAAYYHRAAKLSYFEGCSRGGGQALMEAQRFPDDFDGIVIGAPAFHWTEFMMGFNWDSRAVAAAPIPVGKLPLVEQAVLKQCDASDGLVDGQVTDPRLCRFEPAVLRCQGADAPNCLTMAQIEAFREVFAGPANSSGRRISPGFPPGSESNGGWDVWISGGSFDPPLQFTFQDQFFRYIVFNDPNYNPFTFNFDTDPAKLVNVGLILNAVDPDLRAIERRGTKMVMYHGWNDHALSAHKTIQYYERVGRAMGGLDEVRDFFRFFLAPGVHHCGGGPGPNVFDAFSAMVSWVENGKAPQRIIASGGAVPARTRPLCPYPERAVYKGHGSIDDAANFACSAPDRDNHDDDD